MKGQKVFATVSVWVLLLLLAAGMSQAQGPESTGDGGTPDAIAAAITPVMSYQGRLIESGSPANGSKSMTFRLYTAASGGTKVWEEGPKTVTVSGGLFNAILGDTTPLDAGQFNQELWLEIVVGGTTLPRQKLMGAPYALSLAPGSKVTGAKAGAPLLQFANLSSGAGLQAKSAGCGLVGPALKASADASCGIAVWGENSSTDTTLGLQNNGAGSLIKGFGNDGGEDEFRLGNNGAIATKADTYLFVPGTETTVHYGDNDVVLRYWDRGIVEVYTTKTVQGSKRVQIGIVLPAVLYGQPVKVEELTVFYKTDFADTYIERTILMRQTATGDPGFWSLIDDSTQRRSTTLTSYSLVPTNANLLSAEEGFLSTSFFMHFAGPNQAIRIAGIRLRLGHHPLY